MKLQKINNKRIWEDFILGCQEKTFLSSWNWGEFQKMMGNKIWRLGIFKNNELISVALVVKVIAKRGTFLLVPHGPNVREQGTESKKQILEILSAELKKIAKEEKVNFIRVSPIWRRNEENIKVFEDLSFKTAPIHIHPEATWKLDITLSEEELLMNMRKTTRYLIKQALKNKDIEIFQSPVSTQSSPEKPRAIDAFNNLYQQVVQSQHFIPFSLKYLKNEFLSFNPDNQISLFFGKYKNEIIASAYVLFWSKIGFYHHAALSPRYHKIPVAYLLQWEAIKEAKKRGCNYYDFWGYVNPKDNPKHPWAGPTLFKIGFGGKPYQYVKTQDFPLSNRYWLTYFFEKIRKTKRSL